MRKEKIKELYELRIITDNPVFEGFALKETPSLLGRDNLQDDITPGYGVTDLNKKWCQEKLHRKWQTPEVIGRVVPFNDYPGIDMYFPAFSSRACGYLKDFLLPNGELLPLATDVGEYYFYNITTISDALNTQKSDCEYAPMTIDFFEFHKQKLLGLSIFRIYQWPMGVIVTDSFVDRVLSSGLSGFRFVKIWPYKRGEDWRIQGKKTHKKAAIRKDLKKQTLVLFLQLNKEKPISTEKKAIKKLEDELDAQLVLQSIDAPYFGSYEGIDTLDGEYRLFLSCPDVDALSEKLQPWLNHLEWPNSAYIMKRYGDMYDSDAEETLEQLK
ncbi:hypothetical protein [Gimesia maris]|uniref:Uncharacterized protein n=1 Tax=Gimesia maris TaxID=122 RepID=A0ABX5YPE8_9PLAN|nr:hypothetical protein [Gimesia maris]EDL58364.1 hypothetical protein PM8797T_26950 [Gimesia maris DSM 8797]QEG17541.1 hypothetical protein GmarT_34230 [Gimesia maris]QGQ29395.1 hypothetical protein F1729_12405 [Gimesia maris]